MTAVTTLTKSNKYIGVFYYLLLDGDLTYYITYKIKGKKIKECLGKKSEGVTPQYCHQKRNEAINKARFGDDTPIVKHKRKGGVTFQEASEQYLTNKDLKPATKVKYLGIFSKFNSVISDKTLQEVTIDDLMALKKILQKKNAAPKTINAHTDAIRAVFNYAIDKELFKGTNPCDKVDTMKVDNERERYLGADEVKLLREAIKGDPMILLFVELSLSTGGRLNTILGIEKRDIDFKERTITLHNFKSRNNYKGYISDSLLELLKGRCDLITKPNDLIIPLPFRTVQNRLSAILTKLFNKDLDAKDVKNRVVIHTLRHTFASHLAIKGVPIFTIMKLLDHKDIKDTLRYAKLADKNGLEAVKELW